MSLPHWMLQENPVVHNKAYSQSVADDELIFDEQHHTAYVVVDKEELPVYTHKVDAGYDVTMLLDVGESGHVVGIELLFPEETAQVSYPIFHIHYPAFQDDTVSSVHPVTFPNDTELSLHCNEEGHVVFLHLMSYGLSDDAVQSPVSVHLLKKN